MLRVFLLPLLFVNTLLWSNGFPPILHTYTLDIPEPTGLAWDGSHFIVASRKTGLLYFLKPRTFKLDQAIPSPAKQPLGLAWDGEKLWISDEFQGTLYHMDLKTQLAQVVDEPEIQAHGLAWDGKYLWATKRGNIVKMDPQDGSIISTHEASGRDPTEMTFDGRYFWVSERIDDYIGVYTAEGMLFGLFPSPGPYPSGIIRLKDRLYVLDYQEQTLYVLDIAKPEKPFYFGKPHRRRVTFTQSITVLGPSPLPRGYLYFALPEDGSHQKLLQKPQLLPISFQREKDNWNQTFAIFEKKNIPPGETFQASMMVEVETRDMHTFLLPEWVESLSAIPEEIRKAYTQDGSKLLIHDPFIQEKTQEIVGDEKNPFWIAWKIHHYLMTNMSYQLSGGWNVAPTILKRGNGSCSEFTISFIALARAAGLPARYQAGIVVRGDDGSVDKVYHRWVQVYLPPYGWIPVDSSRGKPASPKTMALEFGSLSHRFLVTTLSGGDSPYLGWQYNGNIRYETKGFTRVEKYSQAKWEPLKEEKP